MVETEKPIVIIGAGFGGLRLARQLSARRASLKRPIILIDQHAHHVYTPLLYEVASACACTDAEEQALLDATTFRFSDLVAQYPGVTFIQERVEVVDCERRTVTCSSGKLLTAATIVFALGSEPDFFGIPGLAEHSFTLKTRESARLIRQRIAALVEEHAAQKQWPIRLVVGGGGPTGVELAAELAGAFRVLERRQTIPKGGWSIVLVEALPRLLMMASPAVSALVEKRLGALGVTVYADTALRRVEAAQVVLGPRPLKPEEKPASLRYPFPAAEEKIVEADMVLWTGGVRGSSFMQKTGLPVDRKGRVIVHGGLGVADKDGIYAIGDCAIPTNPVTQAVVPMLAQAALRQADVVATQILADYGVVVHRKVYTFPAFVYAIPVGGKQAVAAIGGVTFTGFVGWLIRLVADALYFFSLLPFWTAMRLFFSGIRVYSHND